MSITLNFEFDSDTFHDPVKLQQEHIGLIPATGDQIRDHAGIRHRVGQREFDFDGEEGFEVTLHCVYE